MTGFRFAVGLPLGIPAQIAPGAIRRLFASKRKRNGGPRAKIYCAPRRLRGRFFDLMIGCVRSPSTPRMRSQQVRVCTLAPALSLTTTIPVRLGAEIFRLNLGSFAWPPVESIRECLHSWLARSVPLFKPPNHQALGAWPPRTALTGLSLLHHRRGTLAAAPQ